MGKPYSFIESARAMKGRYVLIHFIFILALLFMPVFVIVIRTQPHEMYQRVFSLNFGEAGFEMRQDTGFAPEHLQADITAIYVFEDLVVFHDASMTLYAPSGFFDIETMPYSFEEMFSMIAMYNMYIPHLLIPMIMFSMFVVLVLKGFFYIVTAYFLGAFRAASTYFGFGERFKIAVMSSLPVAIVCVVVGFLVPVVHIILFQMLNLLVLFYIAKRYDNKDKEMLGVM